MVVAVKPNDFTKDGTRIANDHSHIVAWLLLDSACQYSVAISAFSKIISVADGVVVLDVW